MRVWQLAIVLACATAWAENPQLQSAISSATAREQVLQSQTQVLSGQVTTAAADAIALVQKYHLTNAGTCPLFVVAPTTTTTLNLNFIPGPVPIAGVQADIVLPASTTVTAVAIGPAGSAAGKSVSTSVVGGNERVLIFGLNQTAIGAGTVAVATLSSTLPKGTYQLPLTNFTATDASGQGVPLCGVSGLLTK